MFFKASRKNKTNIGTSNKIEGNLFSQEDIIIEGTVIGKISTSGNLEIKKTSRVKANLEAKNIIIAGTVEGDIKAKEKLEITQIGKVYGNIDAKIFSMAAGAVLRGECETGEGKKTEVLVRSEPTSDGRVVIKNEDFEKVASNGPKIDTIDIFEEK